AGEADGLQRKHQTDHLVRELWSGPGRVRQEEVSLQRGKIAFTNPSVSKLSEAGIDPVDRPVVGNGRSEQAGASLDFFPSCLLKPDRRAITCDPAQHRERHLARYDNDSF